MKFVQVFFQNKAIDELRVLAGYRKVVFVLKLVNDNSTHFRLGECLIGQHLVNALLWNCGADEEKPVIAQAIRIATVGGGNLVCPDCSDISHLLLVSLNTHIRATGYMSPPTLGMFPK